MSKNTTPSFEYENIMLSNGFKRIAGVDEAGRGCIAGPLVAAACILPDDHSSDWILKLNDSKKLNVTERETLFTYIKNNCEIGICIIDSQTIDDEGMAKCGRDVLENAVKSIKPLPDCALVDYFTLPTLMLPQINITKGDALSFSIAAASIVAKVTRDHIMDDYAKIYPQYDFEKHKGYCTAQHIKNIHANGLCSIHRKTFCNNI